VAGGTTTTTSSIAGSTGTTTGTIAAVAASGTALSATGAHVEGTYEIGVVMVVIGMLAVFLTGRRRYDGDGR
jgi:hypothetical protein